MSVGTERVGVRAGRVTSGTASSASSRNPRAPFRHAGKRAHGAQAGFSILEALAGVILLGVVGSVLYGAILSGLRSAEAGKARAEQTRQLAYAVDWARANACLLKKELTGPAGSYSLTKAPFSEDRPAVFQRGSWTAGPVSGAGAGALPLLVVEVALPAGVGVGGLTQQLILDLSICRP